MHRCIHIFQLSCIGHFKKTVAEKRISFAVFICFEKIVKLICNFLSIVFILFSINKS